MERGTPWTSTIAFVHSDSTALKHEIKCTSSTQKLCSKKDGPGKTSVKSVTGQPPYITMEFWRLHLGSISMSRDRTVGRRTLERQRLPWGSGYFEYPNYKRTRMTVSYTLRSRAPRADSLIKPGVPQQQSIATPLSLQPKAASFLYPGRRFPVDGWFRQGSRGESPR
jgi:hypothetical protein